MKISAHCSLHTRYCEIRLKTLELCKPLSVEDHVVQTLPDTSPAKWHLAHTTWFFETFILLRFLKSYEAFHPKYPTLFNSYYQSVGIPPCRVRRGTHSRPTVQEIIMFREHVDRAMEKLLSGRDGALSKELVQVVETGISHEEQHQELILTDIKHVYATDPLRPVYHRTKHIDRQEVPALGFRFFPGGQVKIGHEGQGFAFDNEFPQHDVLLKPFRIATRLVTNAQYHEFIEDGGYRRPELWFSDGWDYVQKEGWAGPLYWERIGDQWQIATLAGVRDLNPAEPVCHVSFYEAAAYARWAEKRLASEAEWETAARNCNITGNFVESGLLHPAPFGRNEQIDSLLQFFGDTWEWTSSPHMPYPGYRIPKGAFGEYNGKFMCNQLVARGGSCVTPVKHMRHTYRNFLYPDKRWQFTGIRLAADA